MKNNCCEKCEIHLPYKESNEYQCSDANCSCHSPVREESEFDRLKAQKDRIESKEVREICLALLERLEEEVGKLHIWKMATKTDTSISVKRGAYNKAVSDVLSLITNLKKDAQEDTKKQDNNN